MLKVGLLLLLLLQLGSWFGAAAPPRCTYVFYYQPVCGNDHKTYINYGHLTCQALRRPDLQMLHEGECVVVTTEYPFAELDDENQTVGLSRSNVSLEELREALAKLNITLEEMEAALAQLNMTVDQLNVSSAYLQQQRHHHRPLGRQYDRYGRPYYGYDSDEFGDMSIEFGFGGGRGKVSRLIMAAAIAGAIKHQMDKKHKAKYGGGFGGGGFGGYGGGGYGGGGYGGGGYGGGMFGGSKYGGGGGYPKQPSVFSGSSIGAAPPPYGFKPSVVNPPPKYGGGGGYQPLPPVRPLGHSYPKQPPPYSPPQNPPPYSPGQHRPPPYNPDHNPKPNPTVPPKKPAVKATSAPVKSKKSGSYDSNPYKSSKSGGSKSGGGSRRGGGGRRG